MHGTKKSGATLCLFLTMITVGLAAQQYASGGIIPSGNYTGVGTAGNANASVISVPPTFTITSLGKSFTSIGPLDVAFPVNPSGGTLTYLVTEGITNNTNINWSDYHEILGTGVDGNFVQGSPVDFELPTDSTYTNPAFSTRTVTASEIDYTGGNVIPGQAIALTFSITVPDVGATPYSFTLRQFPTVPEPASLTLVGMATLGLMARRRRVA